MIHFMIEKMVHNKAILMGYLVAFLLHCTGMFTTHWGETQFTVPIEPGVTNQTFYGRSHIGMMRACMKILVNTTEGLEVVDRICLSKLTEDWQVAVVILAIASSLTAATGLVLSVLNVLSATLKEKASHRLAIAMCAGLSSLLMGVVLIIAHAHRTTNLSLGTIVRVTYHSNWSSLVYSAAASVYGLIHVLLVVGYHSNKRPYIMGRLCFVYTDYTESAPLTSDQNPKPVQVNLM